MTLQVPSKQKGRLVLLRDPFAVVGLIGIVILVLIAFFGPYIFGDAAARIDPTRAHAEPSAEHLLGTDALGRDIVARLFVATRLSLLLAVAATLVTVVCGVAIGALPLFLPSRAARAVVAVIDFLVAFPGLLIALFLVVIFGTGATGAVLAIGIAGVPFISRLTYTLASGVIGRDYITASRMLKVRRMRILFRHVIPNIAEPLLLNVAIQTGSNLLAFAALSFLGLGVQAPAYDWGLLLNEGLERIYIQPAAALGTAFVVMIAGMTFSMLGEAAANVFSGRSGLSLRRRSARSSTPAPSSDSTKPTDSDVLNVQDLRVAVRDEAGLVDAVRGVSFSIARGESVGLVGESGSGKSLTAMAVADLLPTGAEVVQGRIQLNGAEPAKLGGRERFAHLRRSVSVVLQDPMNSLNPLSRIGHQLAEVGRLNGQGKGAAKSAAVSRLSRVGIPSPAARAHQYPHEFSGGMRQRVMIAMGLMVTPKLIVADEPTTALDVTVQRQVLDLLDEVRSEHSTSLLLITHDMGVVAERCDRVLVMYAGQIVEELPAGSLTTQAVHRYTIALLASVLEISDTTEGPFRTISGLPPRLRSVPTGCPFAPRCEFADERCHNERPPMAEYGANHRAACWHPAQRVDLPMPVLHHQEISK